MLKGDPNGPLTQGEPVFRDGWFLEQENFEKLHIKDIAGGFDYRKRIFKILRDPEDPFGSGNMPDLAGALTLTKTQYARFKRWSEGAYKDDWDTAWDQRNPPRNLYYNNPPTIEELPFALTRAALGSAVGGSFNPGIEAGNKVADSNTYEAPFRISRTVQPGDITQSLSVPWQADFKLCTQRWWPSARPGSVLVKGNDGNIDPQQWTRSIHSNMDMVKKWMQLGFLFRDDASSPIEYIEKQRTLS